MSIETMTKLATVTVGSGGAASIDFTNIPQTYTDLVVKVSARGTATTFPDLVMSFNSSTANMTRRFLYSDNGTSALSFNDTNSNPAWVNGSGSTTSTFSNTEIYIPSYAGSNNKSFSSDAVAETNATASRLGIFAGLWSQTAAITSIGLTCSSGNFAQHSTATLYGIRNARRAAGNSIKATGGNISFDGTYVVHTFTSSGTFTPTAGLVADYLVVAGGGGGGSGVGGGGGGGAGGYRYFTSQSLTSGTGYTVTVGAGGNGGAGGVNALNSGSDGNTSTFNTTNSTGGGGGAWGQSSNVNGRNGGSGGGAGSKGGTGTGGTGNSGSYSPSEGNNGGGFTGGSNGGGGGGGASAAGGTAGTPPSDAGGAGGAGTANSITGTSVTYAGGGGGGGNPRGAGGAGGGGQGGIFDATGADGAAGTANTGGGGGGGAISSGSTWKAGGNGGSGVVIIRYKA